MKLLDFFDAFITNIFACQPAGKALQPAHQVEQFADVVGVQWPNPGASARQQIDQAFGGQDLERLPQRRAGNLQHLAELPLRNAGAVGDVALDDVGSQRSQYLVMQRDVIARRAVFRYGLSREGGDLVGNQGCHGSSL